MQLFDLEPAKQVTGGPWYTEQVLDTEFIDGVRRAALNALEQAGGAPSSARDIAAFIREGGFSTIPLLARDIETVLDNLVYDGLCDYAGGGARRLREFKRASAAFFPRSGGALKLGYDDAALDAGLFEKTAEELEREHEDADAAAAAGPAGTPS